LGYLDYSQENICIAGGARLRGAGIETVQALRMAPAKWLQAEFGVVMECTGDELRGISCLVLDEVAPAKQQIIASRSFGQMVETEEALVEAISTFAVRAAEKLRQ
jgi:DNA polymerase V